MKQRLTISQKELSNFQLRFLLNMLSLFLISFGFFAFFPAWADDTDSSSPINISTGDSILGAVAALIIAVGGLLVKLSNEWKQALDQAQKSVTGLEISIKNQRLEYDRLRDEHYKATDRLRNESQRFQTELQNRTTQYQAEKMRNAFLESNIKEVKRQLEKAESQNRIVLDENKKLREYIKRHYQPNNE
jgi:septal ring factor EnvC (AmiA/AmiB activator)